MISDALNFIFDLGILSNTLTCMRILKPRVIIELCSLHGTPHLVVKSINPMLTCDWRHSRAAPYP